MIQAALTHRSAGHSNNERLEYLGDAVLGMLVAEHLYHTQPSACEGDLSRLRAYLVRKDTLAELARRICLGDLLTLGPGELKSGGQRRDTILADALEAIIGALYLEGGVEAARRFVLALLAEPLSHLPSPEALKDPKTQLQEFLQDRNLPLPQYAVTAVSGVPHAQLFQVACQVGAYGLTVEATGRSRKLAEQAAAHEALERIEHGD